MLYGVHLEDDKYSHLKKLEKSSKNLKLFKADLLDFDSLHAAIEGCHEVFHVASPVPSTTVLNREVRALLLLAIVISSYNEFIYKNIWVLSNYTKH